MRPKRSASATPSTASSVPTPKTPPRVTHARRVTFDDDDDDDVDASDDAPPGTGWTVRDDDARIAVEVVDSPDDYDVL